MLLLFILLCILCFLMLSIRGFQQGQRTENLSHVKTTSEAHSMPGSSNQCDPSCSSMGLLTYLFQAGLLSEFLNNSMTVIYLAQPDFTDTCYFAVSIKLARTQEPYWDEMVGN